MLALAGGDSNQVVAGLTLAVAQHASSSGCPDDTTMLAVASRTNSNETNDIGARSRYLLIYPILTNDPPIVVLSLTQAVHLAWTTCAERSHRTLAAYKAMRKAG